MKRLLNNWVTSVVGLLVIGVSIYLLATNKIDSVSFGTLLALGFTYLRAKDSLLPGVEAK